VAASTRAAAPFVAPPPAPAFVARKPFVFFDGSDADATEMARYLEEANPGVAKFVDLNDPNAVDAIRSAGREQWAASAAAAGATSLCSDLGKLFLALPDGSVLTNANNERWLLGYELEYWKSVTPMPPAERERMQQTIFGPLEMMRMQGPSPDGQPWWTSPNAVQVWGNALGSEGFAVLDDFLPPQAMPALFAASERLKSSMAAGKTDSQVSTKGRGDAMVWAKPGDVPELGPLIEYLNALVSCALEVPSPAIAAHLNGVSALSDAQVAIFPGEVNPDSRYIRHVDNEDGLNGRLLTCTFYLNEGWDAARDGGELRVFDSDQTTIKADISPTSNRLVVFFSDSTVPHEVRRSRRERRAITIWYLDQEKHLNYHGEELIQ